MVHMLLMQKAQHNIVTLVFHCLLNINIFLINYNTFTASTAFTPRQWQFVHKLLVVTTTNQAHSVNTTLMNACHHRVATEAHAST